MRPSGPLAGVDGVGNEEDTLDCVLESVTVIDPVRAGLPVRVLTAHVEYRGTSGSNRPEE